MFPNMPAYPTLTNAASVYHVQKEFLLAACATFKGQTSPHDDNDSTFQDSWCYVYEYVESRISCESVLRLWKELTAQPYATIPLVLVDILAMVKDTNNL